MTEPTPVAHASEPRTRNGHVALLLGGLVCGMIGLAFASVPLYRLFCQVTGFGGTTQVAESLPGPVSERTIAIRFNADISPDLPWRFQPEVREITLKIGEQGLVFYKATSLASEPTWGTATFNVTPLSAGQYFNKIECFCFTEQRLAAGESLDMGVSFFVDPAIEQDPGTAKLETITLSYTFFPDLDVLEQPQAAEPRTSSGVDSAPAKQGTSANVSAPGKNDPVSERGTL